MKKKLKMKLLIMLFSVLSIQVFLILIMMLVLGGGAITETTQDTFQFKINKKYFEEALEYAKDLHKKSRNAYKMSFVQLLTYALYNSDDWERFDDKYLKEAYSEAKKGRNILNKIENITDLQKMVQSVMGSLVGKYEQMEIKIKKYEDEETGEEKIKKVVEWERKWGLRAYFPIPKRFNYIHYNDFGEKRTYGGSRRHLGNDIIAAKGVPIVSIEAGTVEKMGWDELSGWYIGIWNKDGSKYYYYAHLEKYAYGIKIGSRVNAGQVIGYVGDSGYGSISTVGKFKPHLHLQIQVKYKINREEEKIWIDPYHVLKFLEHKRANVQKKNGIYRCVNEIRIK